jgi:hypothetical protein
VWQQTGKRRRYRHTPIAISQVSYDPIYSHSLSRLKSPLRNFPQLEDGVYWFFLFFELFSSVEIILDYPGLFFVRRKQSEDNLELSLGFL